MLNLATETARDIVANGDIVEFGDLGSLKPSFKSKAVPEGTRFNANIHIEKPVVRLVPSRKYFTLTDVSYEQTTAPATRAKSGTGKGSKEGSSSSEGESSHEGHPDL